MFCDVVCRVCVISVDGCAEEGANPQPHLHELQDGRFCERNEGYDQFSGSRDSLSLSILGRRVSLQGHEVHEERAGNRELGSGLSLFG